MYDAVGYGADFRRVLEEIERELDRPIQTIRGRGRVFSNRDDLWSAEIAHHCGNRTVEDCNERGITIVDWSTLHTISIGILDIPVTLLDQNQMGVINAPTYTLYDCVQPASSGELADLFSVEDFVLGETAPRLVVSYLYHSYFRYLKPEVVKAWIMASLDEGLADRIAERRLTYDLRRFVDCAREGSLTGLRQIENTLTAHERQRTNLQRMLADNEQALRVERARYTAFLEHAGEEQSEDDLREQWTKLNDHPKIKRLRYEEPSILVIETEEVELEHPLTGERVPLGEFRWSVNLANGETTINNLTNARGGFDHPHVEFGSPCFGNLGQTIFTLLRQAKYDAAIEMIFKFLETANVADDWGRRASYWFDPEGEERAARLQAVGVTANLTTYEDEPDYDDEEDEDY